jgi:hypothetical protein
VASRANRTGFCHLAPWKEKVPIDQGQVLQTLQGHNQAQLLEFSKLSAVAIKLGMNERLLGLILDLLLSSEF